MDTIYLENKSGAHYKFYRMVQKSTTQWVAEYGRIGNAIAYSSYLMTDWNKKLNEKINKGYVLVSSKSSKPVTIVREDAFTDKLNTILSVIDGNTTTVIDSDNIVEASECLEYVYVCLDRYSVGINLTKTELIRLNEIYDKYN